MTFETLKSFPVAAQMVLIPLLGALFLVFLPVIGFALLGQAMWQATAGHLASAMGVPTPAPGSAYLQGRETLQAGSQGPSGGDSEGCLDALAAEVADRRRQKP